MNKEAKIFITRAILYLILGRILIVNMVISFFLSIPLLFLAEPIINASEATFFECLFGVYIFTSPLGAYIFAKLLGIFKKLSYLKLTFLKEFLIILLISVLLTILYFIEYPVFKDFFTAETYRELYWFTLVTSFSLIPAFFLNKLFNFLTTKYPYPFNKIAYYSSVEFWKNIFCKNRTQ